MKLGAKIEANKDAIHALDIKFTKEIHVLDTKFTGELSAGLEANKDAIHALELNFGDKLRTLDAHLSGKIGDLEARFPVELQPNPSFLNPARTIPQ